MRWLLTFLAGLLIGAGGLFAWLRQVPHDAPPPAPGIASAAPATPAAAPPAAAVPAGQLEGQLPPAPIVEPDLTEVDLPITPDQPQAALAALPDITGSAKLLVPVEGIKASQLTDNFGQPRGKDRHHEALDIMAPKGTQVLAAGDGKLVKLFKSKAGGLTAYQFDPGENYAYYYAHLDRYAPGVKEGMTLKRGDLVGYVGSTGNADPKAPHLHFAVVELTPEKQWWKGRSINPYPLLAQ
jgi:murein DD-endopeptidase MepM/ murein hydrolase activator NlpD